METLHLWILENKIFLLVIDRNCVIKKIRLNNDWILLKLNQAIRKHPVYSKIRYYSIKYTSISTLAPFFNSRWIRSCDPYDAARWRAVSSSWPLKK